MDLFMAFPKFGPWHLLGASTTAAALVLATPQPAEAVLVFNIIEQLTGITIKGTGSIVTPDTNKGADPHVTSARFATSASMHQIVSGNPADRGLRFNLSGPANFGTTPVGTIEATLSSGDFIRLGPSQKRLTLPSGYISGASLSTTSFYASRTLADLGITPNFRGSLGTWDVVNASGLKFDEVQFAVVPGPLPILGAGVAFGFSRRLRRRISESKSVALTT
jgi:hypothetical protein